jgi:hypothetical protein
VCGQCVAGCCVGQFIVVYLRHRGLSLKRIGIVMGAVYPFMTVSHELAKERESESQREPERER